MICLFQTVNQGSDKRISPNKEFKKESVIESEEVDISEGIQDENENENNVEVEDKNKIPKHIIDQVAAVIGDKWNVLAEKLGYQPDEVRYMYIKHFLQCVFFLFYFSYEWESNRIFVVKIFSDSKFILVFFNTQISHFFPYKFKILRIILVNNT